MNVCVCVCVCVCVSVCVWVWVCVCVWVCLFSLLVKLLSVKFAELLSGYWEEPYDSTT